MDFWRIYVRKIRKEKFRSDTVRATMGVGKDILEINEDKWLR